MAANRIDWVEIIEPKTGEHMYANLTTGECVWDPPEGVPVKRTDSNQWWELFDSNTARFYYYNASSQKTVWHKPPNCDIIPLAKLQTLKQNTDAANAAAAAAAALANQSTQTCDSDRTQPQPQPQQLLLQRHHHQRSSARSQAALSLSASTPQLRRKSNDLCRSSSFVNAHLNKKADGGGSREEAKEDRQQQHHHHQPLPDDHLYSNWNNSHLLPLQNFILYHNSGYQSGYDSDSGSDHSDSGSESLTGHEPDNEDSDQSDGSYIPSHHLAQRVEAEYLNVVPYTAAAANSHHASSNNSSSNSAKYTPSHHSRIATATAASAANVIRGGHQNVPQHYYNSCPRDVQHHRQPDRESQHPVYNPPLPLANPVLSQAAFRPFSEPPIHPDSEDMEKFAADNLNLRGKGLFRRKASVRDMLSWSARAIKRPMLATDHGKQHTKAAIDMFRLVQMYMGDRKANRPGQTLNSVLVEVLGGAFTQTALRDELYVQLCKQTTENHNRESLLRGWEMLSISLSFIPPSAAFQPALLSYLNRHRDPTFARTFPDVARWPIHVQISHYATVACSRLERIGAGGKRKARRPAADDVEASRHHIFQGSLFGNTLKEVMQLQAAKFPGRRLPWPQVELSQQVLRTQGLLTEGIFRVSADVDEVAAAKARLDRWELVEPSDAHVPANLLKLWYRELYEPLIPDGLYQECVSEPMSGPRAAGIVDRLPSLNRHVLLYLIRFLQRFSAPDIVQVTKMDAANLAMVFAPNCLRCTATDPRIIFENARKEMAFLRCLIQDLNTDTIKDVI